MSGPYVVDQFSADEITCVTIGEDGKALARQLSEHPSWGPVMTGLSTGEFWGQVGESLDEEQVILPVQAPSDEPGRAVGSPWAPPFYGDDADQKEEP